MVTDRGALEQVVGDLFRRFDQPVLVETFLPGREFTVGITGTGADAAVLGVSEIVPRRTSSAMAMASRTRRPAGRTRSISCWPIRPTHGPPARWRWRAWRALRCRDGGRIDIRCDAAGKPHFIEVNPLAGLRPNYSDLCFIADMKGLRYRDLIGRIMESFLKRTPQIKLRREPRRAVAA